MSGCGPAKSSTRNCSWARTLETTHPRIKMARERSMNLAELQEHIEALRTAIAIAAGDRAAVRAKLQNLTAPDRGGELGPTPPQLTGAAPLLH